MEREIEQFKNQRPDDPAVKTTELLKSIQILREDFERSIDGGSGASTINTVELSGGAKIKSLFHERFHLDIVRMEFNDKEIRREILFAIQNVRGIKAGLFTPDRAFEVVVKKQIERLKEPSLKCIGKIFFFTIRIHPHYIYIHKIIKKFVKLIFINFQIW